MVTGSRLDQATLILARVRRYPVKFSGSNYSVLLCPIWSSPTAMAFFSFCAAYQSVADAGDGRGPGVGHRGFRLNYCGGDNRPVQQVFGPQVRFPRKSLPALSIRPSSLICLSCSPHVAPGLPLVWPRGGNLCPGSLLWLSSLCSSGSASALCARPACAAPWFPPINYVCDSQYCRAMLLGLTCVSSPLTALSSCGCHSFTCPICRFVWWCAARMLQTRRLVAGLPPMACRCRPTEQTRTKGLLPGVQTGGGRGQRQARSA